MVIAAALGAVTYNLSTFCLTDPPAMPTLTLSDWTALLQPQGYAGNAAVLAKFSDALGNLLWPTLCECTSTTTPAPPTSPSPPSTLAVPQNLPFQTLPCLQWDSAYQQLPVSAVGPFGQVSLPPAATLPAGAIKLPAGYTWIDWTQEVVAHGSTHDTYDFFFREADSASSMGNSHSNLNLGVGVYTVNLYPGSGMGNIEYGFQVLINDHTGTVVGTDLVRSTVTAYCGGQPGQAGCTACPPDPLITALLQQIAGTVNLIQRQAVPFAYVPGTAHSGLSGAGTLTVQGLLGAKIALTTIPASYGLAGTSPTEYFDLGFLTWGTADGFPHSERIEHSPQLSLPSRASAFTELSYDLAPGVVATITELIREP
jgi:hypothetical protein